MYRLYLLLIIIFTYNISGCGIYKLRTPEKRIETVIPIEEPQEFFISVTEGKTNKQQIIEALGMPDELNESWISYSFRKAGEICRLNLNQKDGTVLNIILGNGHKYRGARFHLDEGQPNIVKSVSIG